MTNAKRTKAHSKQYQGVRSIGWVGEGTLEGAGGGTLLKTTTTVAAGAGTPEKTPGASLGATGTPGK